jgi:hypothetical protein
LTAGCMSRMVTVSTTLRLNSLAMARNISSWTWRVSYGGGGESVSRWGWGGWRRGRGGVEVIWTS